MREPSVLQNQVWETSGNVVDLLAANTTFAFDPMDATKAAAEEAAGATSK